MARDVRPAAGATAPGLATARRGLFESYRRQGMSEWIQVTGASMRPLIGRGSWVLVAFGAIPQRPGQIVLFFNGDTMVVHRVAGVRRLPARDAITTKGDAEVRFDPPVAVQDVLGIVVARRASPWRRPRSLGCEGLSARAAGALSTAVGVIMGWTRPRVG